LFGRDARKSESELEQFHMDVAASIQKVAERAMLACVNHVHDLTGQKNLCLAGGVALNCVGNGRVLRESKFDNLWIQPAAGDAGGALGTALFIWHQLLDHSRETCTMPDRQAGSFLGPQFSDEQARTFFDGVGAVYEFFEDEQALCDHVAQKIDDGCVIGWMEGRMEFGPRALGGRSILGDPRSTKMQSLMNLKIKFRESFRPFAPSILRERVSEYFQMKENEDSPYMLLVAPVQDDKRLNQDDAAAQEKQGIEQLKQIRSVVPAITHVDYSARVQTVDPQRHGRYYKLIKAFEKRTGCPILINTSFNVRGEPIVCTPADAYHCFIHTNMDVLVVDNYVLIKQNQPNLEDVDMGQYLKQFALD